MHDETDQLVRLTGKSPSTVHVFLCALKQFYHLARRKEWYPYPHPLTDPTTRLLQDIEAEERREADSDAVSPYFAQKCLVVIVPAMRSARTPTSAPAVCTKSLTLPVEKKSWSKNSGRRFA